jgi:translation initiation factor 4A
MTEDKVFKTFDDMEFLNFELMKGIFDYGFQSPSKIQNLTIKNIFDGYDIIAQSQSGTGKTGAFTIGALSVVDPTQHHPQVLIMATTRELATQIHFVISNISKHMNIKIELAIGGTQIVSHSSVSRSESDRASVSRSESDRAGVSRSESDRVRVSRSNVSRSRDPYNHIRTAHIIIGTPGRIFDYINRKAFDPKKLSMFIMDEADALLKDDFIDQIKDIYSTLDSACQVIIFSATYTDEILEIAESITQEPRKKILMKYEELSLDLIKQYKVEVRYENIKYSTLADLYTKLQIGQCIIFVNSINTANILEKKLIKDGFGVSKIHGELTTEQRTSILKDFRLGLSRVLIATDVLSRGIDIEQIGIVINYDLPRDFAQYIHRIGRSGRFGKIGVAINFITNNDHRKLEDLENHYKIKIDDMPSPNTINQFLSGVGGHLKLNLN